METEVVYEGCIVTELEWALEEMITGFALSTSVAYGGFVSVFFKSHSCREPPEH
jgi:hypothetical protein